PPETETGPEFASEARAWPEPMPGPAPEPMPGRPGMPGSAAEPALAPGALARGAVAVDGAPQPSPGGIEPEPLHPRDRRRRIGREFAALGWIWAAIVLTYLFGFQIGGAGAPGA